jgi:hypothetical protein
MPDLIPPDDDNPATPEPRPARPWFTNRRIQIYLKQSFRRGLPYALFLIFYGLGLAALRPLGKDLPGPIMAALVSFAIGGSIAAVYAGWQLALAFAPDSDYANKAIRYLAVEAVIDQRDLGEQLIGYRKNLRMIALSYERQRLNLTRIAILIAVLLVSVPIVTWVYILAHAFDGILYPNAWKVVFSSSTTGAIGLAIAVTILRHVNNSQRALTEIQERMFDALEAGMAINAANIPENLRLRALENVLTTLSVLRSRQLAEARKDDEPSSERAMMMDILSAALSGVPKSG